MQAHQLEQPSPTATVEPFTKDDVSLSPSTRVQPRKSLIVSQAPALLSPYVVLKRGSPFLPCASPIQVSHCGNQCSLNLSSATFVIKAADTRASLDSAYASAVRSLSQNDQLALALRLIDSALPDSTQNSNATENASRDTISIRDDAGLPPLLPAHQPRFTNLRKLLAARLALIAPCVPPTPPPSFVTHATQKQTQSVFLASSLARHAVSLRCPFPARFSLLTEQGDGNCLFRALARSLYGTPRAHRAVRTAIAHWLALAPPQLYEAFLAAPPVVYAAKLARLGEWGGEVELQAAADVYGCEITVYAFKPRDANKNEHVTTCSKHVALADQKLTLLNAQAVSSSLNSADHECKCGTQLTLHKYTPDPVLQQGWSRLDFETTLRCVRTVLATAALPPGSSRNGAVDSNLQLSRAQEYQQNATSKTELAEKGSVVNSDVAVGITCALQLPAAVPHAAYRGISANAVDDNGDSVPSAVVTAVDSNVSNRTGMLSPAVAIAAAVPAIRPTRKVNVDSSLLSSSSGSSAERIRVRNRNNKKGNKAEELPGVPSPTTAALPSIRLLRAPPSLNPAVITGPFKGRSKRGESVDHDHNHDSSSASGRRGSDALAGARAEWQWDAAVAGGPGAAAAHWRRLSVASLATVTATASSATLRSDGCAASVTEVQHHSGAPSSSAVTVMSAGAGAAAEKARGQRYVGAGRAPWGQAAVIKAGLEAAEISVGPAAEMEHAALLSQHRGQWMKAYGSDCTCMLPTCSCLQNPSIENSAVSLTLIHDMPQLPALPPLPPLLPNVAAMHSDASSSCCLQASNSAAQSTLATQLNLPTTVTHHWSARALAHAALTPHWGPTANHTHADCQRKDLATTSKDWTGVTLSFTGTHYDSLIPVTTQLTHV